MWCIDAILKVYKSKQQLVILCLILFIIWKIFLFAYIYVYKNWLKIIVDEMWVLYIIYLLLYFSIFYAASCRSLLSDVPSAAQAERHSEFPLNV